MSGTTLYFKVKNEYGNIRMSFADNGLGLSMEMRQHIFPHFVMGDAPCSSHEARLDLLID